MVLPILTLETPIERRTTQNGSRILIGGLDFLNELQTDWGGAEHLCLCGNNIRFYLGGDIQSNCEGGKTYNRFDGSVKLGSRVADKDSDANTLFTFYFRKDKGAGKPGEVRIGTPNYELYRVTTKGYFESTVTTTMKKTPSGYELKSSDGNNGGATHIVSVGSVPSFRLKVKVGGRVNTYFRNLYVSPFGL